MDFIKLIIKFIIKSIKFIIKSINFIINFIERQRRMNLINTINKNDLEILKKLMGQEAEDFVAKWEGLLTKLKSSSKITIANTGLFSSGKSSLFNALLGRVDNNERFKVGAAPTTRKGNREALTYDIDILDTPGIDADDRDDKTAFSSLMESDIIIVTHNVKMGMLNKAEFDWLKRIINEIGKEDIISQRVIFACTWIDERKDEQDRKKVTDEIKRQINNAVSECRLNTAKVNIAFWELSSKRFYTAVKNKKTALEKASGIPEFKEFLLSRAGYYSRSVKSSRSIELKILCNETRKKLYLRKTAISHDISMREYAVRSRYSGNFTRWAGILSRFKNTKSTVEDKLKSLASEYNETYSWSEFKKSLDNTEAVSLSEYEKFLYKIFNM